MGFNLLQRRKCAFWRISNQVRRLKSFAFDNKLRTRSTFFTNQRQSGGKSFSLILSACVRYKALNIWNIIGYERVLEQKTYFWKSSRLNWDAEVKTKMKTDFSSTLSRRMLTSKYRKLTLRLKNKGEWN